MYPYLLRALEIVWPGQVYPTDIRYVRVGRSSTGTVTKFYLGPCLTQMDTGLCMAALEEALMTQGPAEIFNTDQDSEVTSETFT